MRTTVYDARIWPGLAKAAGLCVEDIAGVCEALNLAIYNLVLAGGETGWHGGWQKVVFTVLNADPYITLPRGIARIIDLAVDTIPRRIRNEFYEFLPDGIGPQDPASYPDWCGDLAGYERGTYPTMVDVATTNQLLRVYCSDPRDVGKRIMIKGKDNNGLQIFSTDGALEVNGFYLTMAAPFVTSGFQVSVIDNVMKDATYGDVLLYQVDATTGAQVLLSRYAPDELTPEYRRYYLKSARCCSGSSGSFNVTGMAKLDFVRVSRDTDFLLIGCLPALALEIESNRYSGADSALGKGLSAASHAGAIKLLQQELVNYGGRQRLAVNVKPFGSARLEDHMIGQLI